MTLRNQISLAATLIRFGGGLGLALAGTQSPSPAILITAGVLWLLLCGPVMRHLILPAMFPETTCPGCRRIIPLVGRFKCGGHYTDHRERHILSFHCVQGHLVEGFDCPRCQSTILVQRGNRTILRHGAAVRLRTVSHLADTRGLLMGYDEKGREIRLPESRLAWHTAITGGTGRGKSTLLCNLARQLAFSDSGFTILDPGGDLARAVLKQIPSEREHEVIYLDVGDREHPFALNLLSGRSELERAVLVEELLGVFHRLHGAAWGPLLAHQLRMALKSVMEAGGTLRDVYGMFVDGRVRARIVGKTRNADLRSFWEDEFPAIPAIRRTAVTNKLAPVVFHPVLAPIICAKQCVLNMDRAIRERQIVIVNLASGSPADDVTTLLGTFVVQKAIAAAFRQGEVPEQRRIRHVLIVDEFQRFMHRAASFDQILAESRKFKLSLIVANQYVEQLATEVRAALFGNVGCLAAFRVGHRDARVLIPEFSGAVAEELLELELGECLVRIGTDWTKVKTPPPPRVQESDPSDRIVAVNRKLSPRAKSGKNAMSDKESDDETEGCGEFVR